MQLHITHKLTQNLELPINYQHILQSIIYDSIKDDETFGSLHDQGYAREKRRYKMFCFSQIYGKYTIKDKRIIFSGEITWEIRSVDEEFIFCVQKAFLKKGIRYGEYWIPCEKLEIQNKMIETDSAQIKMRTPLCVYSSNVDGLKTKYYCPNDTEFVEHINDNFCRKYEAFYGTAPKENIDIQTVKLNPKDKKVVKYKDIYINGWMGVYELKGKKEYINFLYNTGLGGKNSIGFGFFVELT